MNGIEGKRVLLTRSSEDNAVWSALLKERDIHPATLACIRCETLHAAAAELARELAECDWLALSSRRGARAVADLHPAPLPQHLSVACVGPQTAAEAKGLLGRADRVAPDGTGRSLGVELAAILPRSARVLVAAANGGRNDIEDVLAPTGVDVRRVEVYRTEPVGARFPRLRLSDLALDAVFFASPSAVRGFVNQATVPAGARVVTLGPTTTEAAREVGVDVHAEATTRGFDGMLAAYADLLRPENRS